MDLAWLRARQFEKHPDVMERAASMDHSLDTLRTVRRIASELAPPMLNDFGLVAALEWQLEQLQKRAGVRCTVKIGAPEVHLDKDREIAVFRVVQEALTNVVRHAGATKVDFYLDVGDSDIVIEVSDNGKGISKADIEKPASLGLTGMRERIHQVGGEFKIAALFGGGTRISLRVPKSA